MKRNLKALWVSSFLFFSACGPESSALLEEGLEEEHAGFVESELNGQDIPFVPLDMDIEKPWNLNQRFFYLWSEAIWARNTLGPYVPDSLFANHWVMGVRIPDKNANSRLEVSRITIAHTRITYVINDYYPAPGCQHWGTNEVAVVQVPKLTARPHLVTPIRRNLPEACGVTPGPACNDTLACPQATPTCLGGFQRPDGTYANGQCVKLHPFDKAHVPCSTDAACGDVGYCSKVGAGSTGVCQPKYTRGTYTTERLNLPIPRSPFGTRASVTVNGLLPFPMQAWAQVYFREDSRNQVGHLRFRLINPAGTVTAELPVAALGAKVLVPVPLNEHVNGEWTVEVRDVRSAGAALTSLRAVRLSFTSRTN